jgi:sulfate adenylyltransferase subunit 1
MEVLKIATAGSVDDGKSTLIGRLLFETDSLTQDKLEAIWRSSKNKGYDYPDLSLATDGLVAEREQGITIDVAHIYFSTLNRRYIIADSPGHVEYTRNMITGTSTSQASIVLIDASKGVKEQTARHLFINKLLGIHQLIFAINKMDLVSYDQEAYIDIINQVRDLIELQGFDHLSWQAVPVSALYGEGISTAPKAMPWYTGPTLLEALEQLSVEESLDADRARFVVQAVIRPEASDRYDFRGYAGRLNGGSFKKGEHITVLPSLQTGTISDIHFFNKSYDQVGSGTSCTLLLSNDVDVSRGCVLVKTDDVPDLSRTVKATLCWLDDTQLSINKRFYFQQGTKTVQAKIKSVDAVYNSDFQAVSAASDQLELNEVAEVNIQLSDPIINEDFAHQRSMGRFVLIDSSTNNTVALGLIRK